MRHLLCILFGLGHRWETHTDAEGSVTSCRRCGKLRHTATDFDPPVDPEPYGAAADAARNIQGWP